MSLSCPEPCWTATLCTESGEEIELGIRRLKGNYVLDEVSSARLTADTQCVDLPFFCPGLSQLKVYRDDCLAWVGPIIEAWQDENGLLELDARDGLWWLTRRVCPPGSTYATSTVAEFLALVDKINNPHGEYQQEAKQHYDFERVVASVNAGPDGVQTLDEHIYASTLARDLADTTIDYTVVAGELYVGYGTVPIPPDRYCEINLAECDWLGLPPWGVSVRDYYNDLYYFSNQETTEGDEVEVFTRATADSCPCGLYQELEATSISHASLVDATELMLESQSVFNIGQAQSGDLAPTAPVDFKCLVPGAVVTLGGRSYELVEVDFDVSDRGETISLSVA